MTGSVWTARIMCRCGRILNVERRRRVCSVDFVNDLRDAIRTHQREKRDSLMVTKADHELWEALEHATR